MAIACSVVVTALPCGVFITTTFGGGGDAHIIDTVTGAPNNFQIVSGGRNRLGDLVGRADCQPVICPNDGLQFFCLKACFDIRINAMRGKHID